jgi:hypothetical protein
MIVKAGAKQPPSAVRDQYKNLTSIKAPDIAWLYKRSQ